MVRRNQKGKLFGGAGQLDSYSIEKGDRVCELIVDGKTLDGVAAELDCDVSTILKWLHKYEGFNKQYYKARQLQMERIIDGILVIADDGSQDWKEEEDKRGQTRIVVDHEHIARSRLKIDTRKWLAAKIYPKMYGDKIMVDSNEGVTATLIIKNEPPDADKD